MTGYQKNQINPFSSGGGGYNFEVHVQTYIAIHIIAGDKLPFFDTEKPIKMKLQGHYDGYDTDDCIVLGEKGGKVLCQIKHSITVGMNDDVFHAVIVDAWNDFSNTYLFNRKTDSIVLIVAGLSKKDIDNTRILFQWAMGCGDEKEFTKKVTTDKFSSKDKQKKFDAIMKQLQSAKGSPLSDFEVWDFFRHFNIQVLELDSTKSPLFAAVSNMLSRMFGQSGLESVLYRYIAGYNQNAGTITREKLLQDLNLKDIIIDGYFTEISEDCEETNDKFVSKEIEDKEIVNGKPKLRDAEFYRRQYINSHKSNVLTIIPAPVDLIGREEDVKAIKKLLCDSSIISIKADAGFGKTSLALFIINAERKELAEGVARFSHFAWITSSGNIADDLSNISIPVDPIILKCESVKEAKLRCVIEWLQENPTLIIIDNMDYVPSPMEMDVLNTIVGKTKFIITSRSNLSLTYRNIVEYPLKNIDEESAQRLFCRYYYNSEENYVLTCDSTIVLDIVRILYCNALLVELLAKWSYWENPNLYELKVLLKEDKLSFDPPITVLTSHDKSHNIITNEENHRLLYSIRKLYSLSRLDAVQTRLMQFMAAFPAETFVYKDFLIKAGFKLNEIIWLVNRGWIEKKENNYVIHPMIKYSIELQNKEISYEFNIWDYEILINHLAYDDYMPRKDSVLFVLSICEYIKKSKKKTRLAGDLLYFVIQKFCQLSSSFDNYALDAWLIRKETTGNQSEETAFSAIVVGDIYYYAGDYYTASCFYWDAYAILEQKLEKSDVNLSYLSDRMLELQSYGY